jgi:hypothetical protein
VIRRSIELKSWETAADRLEIHATSMNVVQLQDVSEFVIVLQIFINAHAEYETIAVCAKE